MKEHWEKHWMEYYAFLVWLTVVLFFCGGIKQLEYAQWKQTTGGETGLVSRPNG